MTIETPTAETKGKEPVTEILEPTLSTQVEPLGDNVIGDELVSGKKHTFIKKRSAFNNVFSHKGTKKEVITDDAPVTTDTEIKKSKPFGNFLSRVKQTTSSSNIKEMSEPTEEECVEHEDENFKSETPAKGDHGKRQSILSKLFGNTKKEPMADSSDQVVTTTTEDQQTTEKVTPSSPPLSRRVTGFFSKKKNEKKQNKSIEKTDKVESNQIIEDMSPKDDNQEEEEETPAVIVNEEVPATSTTVTSPISTTTSNAQGITA